MRGLPDVPEQPDHWIEALYIGGGFTCLRDSTIKKMGEVYPELRFMCNPDLDPEKSPTYAYWTTVLIDRPDWGAGAREYLSEDYSFCHRVRAAGEKVAMDLTVKLTHWDGDKSYALPMTNEKERDKTC